MPLGKRSYITVVCFVTIHHFIFVSYFLISSENTQRSDLFAPQSSLGYYVQVLFPQ